MYEDLIVKLKEDKSWVEQGTTRTEHEITEHIQQAIDAIEELNSKVNKLYCLICDVNAKEVATQIESGNFYNFLNSFRKCADKIVGYTHHSRQREEF